MSLIPLARLLPGRRSWGRSAAALAIAAVFAALFTAPAQAADGQITGLGGKCVDVAGASNASGTPVQLYDCNGSNAQRWSLPGDGTIRALGKCLDIVDRGTADGSLVQLWDCAGTPNQQWVVTGANDIVNPQADKCLDVRDRSTANGTRLQIWTCSGQSNQKWSAPGGGNPQP
ncbi:ricin-type beta-trefoil lectin domain protein, partial [Streptomyces sp. NPDC056437]|uniref:ricin-type beta-trefoil lectin domain protein n=1 Tax=Streptomyces sp. NPDC056437 TaxID=3345816 RepID=UPI0036AA0FF1